MEINLAPIVSDYYLDDNLVTLIIGPVGSGKTLGSIAKLERLMHEQEPSTDGIRYTRWAIIRNTYLELKDTTIKSFIDFFGDTVRMNWGNMTALYEHDDIRAEFLFRSLDKPDDMRKLLSLEITGAYLNEMRELSHDALQNIISRLGRYPSAKDGVGCTKSNVIADSNAFEDDHWIYNLFLTDKKPDNYSVYIQPPALNEENEINPEAENIDNLPHDYYTRQLAGATKNFVDIMLKVKFVSRQTGKPVYPEYNDAIHCVPHGDILPPSRDLPLICGADNGRWSAFVIGQQDPMGRVVIFDEITSEDVNLTDFSEIIAAHMKRYYADYKMETWIDPWAANQRGQLTDATMFKVYQKAGLNPRVSRTGHPDTMVEAVKRMLGRSTAGQQNITISNKCKKLRKGFNGGYSYRRIQTSVDKYADKPDKGAYSHICFVKDTKILTINGHISIQNLSVGDYVSTPKGYRKITTTIKREAEVINIGDVTCTIDHPFYTTNGYLRADALKFLVKQEGSLLWKIHWLLKMQEGSTKFIYSMVLDTIKEDSIMRMKQARGFISAFGNTIKEKFQKITTFTTSILTDSITTLRTCSAYHKESTINYTCSKSQELNNRERILKKQEKVLKSGTKTTLKKEKQSHLQLKKNHKNSGITLQHLYATNVEKNIRFINQSRIEEKSLTAHHNVEASIIKRDIWWKLNVLIVEMLLKLQNTLRQKPVASHVGTYTDTVYNITVEDAHCYYANGYLVSNCNAAEFLIDGIGGSRELLKSNSNREPVVIDSDWNVL